MKKTIKILSAIILFSLLSAGITFGQNTNTGKMEKHEKNEKHEHEIVEKVKMKDGKMMMKQGGDWVTMDKDMTMENGTTVMKDGTVKVKEGGSIKLQEGDCVDEKGHIYDKNKKMKGMEKEKMKEHNKDVKKND